MDSHISTDFVEDIELWFGFTPGWQPTLETAIYLATQVHLEKVDKGGKPLILHALRVMLEVEHFGDEAMIVAVLHDTIEDTAREYTRITVKGLHAFGYSQIITDALDAVSRREGEVYKDYIKRCAQNKLAKEVKIKDLRDNMSAKRFFEGEEYMSLFKRYAEASYYLEVGSLLEMKGAYE